MAFKPKILVPDSSIVVDADVLAQFARNAPRSRLATAKEYSSTTLGRNDRLLEWPDVSRDEHFKRTLEELFSLSPSQCDSALSNLKRDFLVGSNPPITPRDGAEGVAVQLPNKGGIPLYKDQAKPRVNNSEAFLREVWGAWLGRLSQSELASYDAELLVALDNAFRGRREELLKLLPTKNNRRLADTGLEFRTAQEAREYVALARAAARRLEKHEAALQKMAQKP